MDACSDWSSLAGSWVEVRRDQCVVRAGRVEIVTGDSSILWIAADGARPRELFEAAEGFRAVPLKRQQHPGVRLTPLG
jgi:hypothetical protein